MKNIRYLALAALLAGCDVEDDYEQPLDRTPAVEENQGISGRVRQDLENWQDAYARGRLHPSTYLTQLEYARRELLKEGDQLAANYASLAGQRIDQLCRQRGINRADLR